MVLFQEITIFLLFTSSVITANYLHCRLQNWLHDSKLTWSWAPSSKSTFIRIHFITHTMHIIQTTSCPLCRCGEGCGEVSGGQAWEHMKDKPQLSKNFGKLHQQLNNRTDCVCMCVVLFLNHRHCTCGLLPVGMTVKLATTSYVEPPPLYMWAVASGHDCNH